jgi:hypothetical protein
MAEFNIVGANFDHCVDMKLFFTDDQIKNKQLDIPLTRIDPSDRTLAHLFTRLGKFSSVGEAKRNGWDKEIPSGWSHFTIGKGSKRWDFFIWNPTHTLAQFNELFGTRHNNAWV